MEPFNESSILLTTSLTPELINQLTFAPESKNPYGFKGLLSDVYIWKRFYKTLDFDSITQ